jgi:hypothetical protein
VRVFASRFIVYIRDIAADDGPAITLPFPRNKPEADLFVGVHMDETI